MTEQPKDGGAAFDLAQMIADREAGTPGPWVYEYTCIGHTVLQPGEINRGFEANHAGKPEPDARRIARVPLMETEIIRLTARVAELEAALGVVNDDYYFYQLDSETMFAVEQALSTHTEEIKL